MIRGVCHAPGCGLSASGWGCRRHWAMISAPLRRELQDEPGWRWRFVATHRVMMAFCALADDLYTPTTAIESLSDNDADAAAWSRDMWKVATGEPVIVTSR